MFEDMLDALWHPMLANTFQGSMQTASLPNRPCMAVYQAASELRAVRPSKKDCIKVLHASATAGEEALVGQAGSLIGTDGLLGTDNVDGIVKMDASGDIKILDLRLLGLRFPLS